MNSCVKVRAKIDSNWNPYARCAERRDVAEMCGIVEKGGAWYTVNGERFQGRAKAVAYLKENPKVVSKLIEDINAKS